MMESKPTAVRYRRTAGTRPGVAAAAPPAATTHSAEAERRGEERRGEERREWITSVR
jgi:hypothetical protein